MKTDPLSRQLDEARYRLTREIRENPLLCVGIALGVGAVIGALASRSGSRAATGSRRLSDLASQLSEQADALRSTATRGGQRAGRELQSAFDHLTDAAPAVDLDRLILHGRRWLRSLQQR